MFPAIDCSLQEARVSTRGERLIVSTGQVQRVWQWTDGGLATRQIEHLLSARCWTNEENGPDWQLPDASEPPAAVFRSMVAGVQDDEGFTSEHIAIEVEIAYPAADLLCKLIIWAYPGSPGIRTQLAVRRTKPYRAPERPRRQGRPVDARVERLPPGRTGCRRRFFGYYNETQQRNDTHQSILKEHVLRYPSAGREWCAWASAACLEDEAGGFALVKESHKCVNQNGHAAGGFIVDESEGLLCTGWGLRADEVGTDAFVAGWASWCILWDGGDFERQMAFKTFDRQRYPIDLNRDMYIQANTWGSTDNGCDARRAAGPDSVLREIESCADMGIDSLQIDDGWQVPSGSPSWDPAENGWHPHPQTYPDGWRSVRERAEERKVRLGLWAAAIPIQLDELKANFKEGGFVQYKLDFASLRSRADIDALMAKVRDFIKWTGHRVRVNWDVTENAPRYGYFFARDYGCIYLENRKPEKPLSVVYRPHTVLRDLWQVAKYLPLHRFQCSIQNVDRVDPDYSDAHLHSHSYATAIALMGIPLFFTETKYFTESARTEIRDLLRIYKEHREQIYSGIVHPIGDQPDNAAWTGFQCHLEEQGSGYLTVFRERCNSRAEHSLQLAWLRSQTIRITDLVSGADWSQDVDDTGKLTLSIKRAPDFRFLRYDLP